MQGLTTTACCFSRLFQPDDGSGDSLALLYVLLCCVVSAGDSGGKCEGCSTAAWDPPGGRDVKKATWAVYVQKDTWAVPACGCSSLRLCCVFVLFILFFFFSRGCFSLPMSPAVLKAASLSPATLDISEVLLGGWFLNMGRSWSWPISVRFSQ